MQGDIAVKKQIFGAAIGGVAFLTCVSPAFAQQTGEEGASATLSFSGQGNGPIEVRDADGKLQQVFMPNEVRLNQPPAHVLKRERAHREKRREEIQAHRALKKEEKRIAGEEAAAAARLAEEQRIAADEKAAQLAASQAEKPLNPYRVRRRTVRRKIVEDETSGAGTAPPKARP